MFETLEEALSWLNCDSTTQLFMITAPLGGCTITIRMNMGATTWTYRRDFMEGVGSRSFGGVMIEFCSYARAEHQKRYPVK